tara:strand:- start:10752 stop:13040 length:2289 start_codon:yes stop_codon:yes gene_type:complete
MAWEKNRIKSGLTVIRGESGSLISADNMAGEIKNMNETQSGTLRSVNGPVEYVPSKLKGGQSVLTYADPLLGIFHCRVEGGSRDILLAHFTNSSGESVVSEYQGWSGTWQVVLGPNSLSFPKYQITLPESDGRPRFLTQFEALPNGVVIVPQGGRAYFYDGYAVLPLGYDSIPGSPTGDGPESSTKDGSSGSNVVDDPNSSGYSHNGLNMNRIMGTCRIGSVDNNTVSVQTAARKRNPLGGTLQNGEWRAAVQWLDRWGNVSPISNLSSPVSVDRVDNLTKDSGKDPEESSDRLKVQVAWSGISPGPDGTIGRILCRTRDTKLSGITGVFEVPNHTATSFSAIASIPDNVSTDFPDNVPDSWLIKRPIDPVPVPLFKLCKVAFGRLWIANWPGGEGIIRPSEPLFWGTFPRDMEIIPDPTGNHITGMWNTSFGLLVFTDSSTFLVTPNNEGTGFKAATLNNSVGCVSPDSIATLPNGLTVWLGDREFYAYDGEKVYPVSRDIKENVMRRINRGYQLKACAAVDMTMGEYRCAIPVDGSVKNNLTIVFDGEEWRERDDVRMQAVCTTRDHRNYMLALGYADATNTDTSTAVPNMASVWVLDHDGRGVFEADQHEGIVETHWLKPAASFRRSTPVRVKIWLKETINSTLTVEVYRDWRDHPVVETAVSPNLYPTDDPPPFWKETVLGGTHTDALRPNSSSLPIDNSWSRRRPHWVVADVMVPAAEVYKFRLKFTGDWDFIGLVFEDIDSDGGGAKIPTGGSSGS